MVTSTSTPGSMLQYNIWVRHRNDNVAKLQKTTKKAAVAKERMKLWPALERMCFKQCLF